MKINDKAISALYISEVAIAEKTLLIKIASRAAKLDLPEKGLLHQQEFIALHKEMESMKIKLQV